MSEPEPFPKQDRTLKLRGRVRPVTRINRRVLFAGAALGVLGLFAALWVALVPPKAAGDLAPEVRASSGARRTPESLARLPVTYEYLAAPRLGAPMAGDLGGTIVAEERAWGVEPDWDVAPADGFRPSEFDEAVRAKRLADAKLADAAGKAGLFFDLSARPGPAASDSGGPATPELASELLALAYGGASPPEAPADMGDANLQARKIAFAESPPDRDIYNPYELEEPVSPYQVMAGTLVPASLVTGINSDLPGLVIAQVTRPVYDTVSGVHLLIPQGARLLGRYQSQVSFGQDRALVVWERIIFPDGSSIRIAEPATDPSGAAGLSGRTDHHWDRVFTAAGLATLLGIGAEIGNDDGSDLERAVRRGFGDSVSRTGQQVVDRNLGIQPTIRVGPGTPVRVLVTRDLILRPYSANER